MARTVVLAPKFFEVRKNLDIVRPAAANLHLGPVQGPTKQPGQLEVLGLKPEVNESPKVAGILKVIRWRRSMSV